MPTTLFSVSEKQSSGELQPVFKMQYNNSMCPFSLSFEATSIPHFNQTLSILLPIMGFPSALAIEQGRYHGVIHKVPVSIYDHSLAHIKIDPFDARIEYREESTYQTELINAVLMNPMKIAIGLMQLWCYRQTLADAFQDQKMSSSLLFLDLEKIIKEIFQQEAITTGVFQQLQEDQRPLWKTFFYFSCSIPEHSLPKQRFNACPILSDNHIWASIDYSLFNQWLKTAEQENRMLFLKKAKEYLSYHAEQTDLLHAQKKEGLSWIIKALRSNPDMAIKSTVNLARSNPSYESLIDGAFSQIREFCFQSIAREESFRLLKIEYYSLCNEIQLLFDSNRKLNAHFYEQWQALHQNSTLLVDNLEAIRKASDCRSVSAQAIVAGAHFAETILAPKDLSEAIKQTSSKALTYAYTTSTNLGSAVISSSVDMVAYAGASLTSGLSSLIWPKDTSTLPPKPGSR